MASWGSYVFELCRINANQGLTAEIDWNYTSWSRRCRKILIGLVVRGAKTVVVRGKNRILTRNRKKPEMTVPISLFVLQCRRAGRQYRRRQLFATVAKRALRTAAARRQRLFADAAALPAVRLGQPQLTGRAAKRRCRERSSGCVGFSAAIYGSKPPFAGGFCFVTLY